LQPADLVALVPSCALMFNFEWPPILAHDAAVKKLADATFDLSEYVIDIARKEGLAPGLGRLEGGVSVHLACTPAPRTWGRRPRKCSGCCPTLKSP
jgi:glycerol-3-phosphate dehydrogenase subunit C